LQRDFGMLQFERKNYAEAARHLAKAVDLGISDPPIYNFLGISYSKTGRLSKAISSYKKAISLNPQLAEAHLNLGYAYEVSKKPQPAAAEYAAACKLEPKYCEHLNH